MTYCTSIVDVAHMDHADLREAATGGIVAVILKVCTGVDALDPEFKARIFEAVGAGLLVSGYAFGTGEHPGDAQWRDFRDRWDAGCASVSLAPKSVPVWLDLESNGDNTMTPDQARAWLAAGQADGYRVGLYGGLSKLTDHFRDPNDAVGRVPLWLAAYGNEPKNLPAPWASKGWRLWQYTDGKDGPSDRNSFPRTAPGCGPCDRSGFAGTDDDLRAWWRQG